ncbi:TetR family transcriptional regulator [uncultured Tolumonas sp.]|uniref:TetR family transcriptional regulator n=1 Tax=uncultured Tolumonas sp. TaxID=263765 RepID=UPI002931AFC0|nr:TetR family transcriptional regulator [uncultured Tolumonas sp.]
MTISSKNEFCRARTEEQRQQRRTHILGITKEMLQDRRLADLSFNEIAKRVGLAKSNIMRYFDSRESILLTLLLAEYDDWVKEVEYALENRNNTPPVELLSEVLSSTIMARSLMCELLSAAPMVLEHNVSTEEIIKFKLSIQTSIRRLMTIISSYLGEWDAIKTGIFVSEFHACVTHTWSLVNPSPALKTAYITCPDIAVLSFPAHIVVRETIATLIVGLNYRQPNWDANSHFKK